MEASPRFDCIDDEMAAILRRKTPAERLEIAAGMWRFARTMLLATLKGEHPEWDDARIEEETSRRLSHGAV